MAESIGFIGLGRLGSVIATLLLEAGNPLLCCARGRSEEVVAKGATIAGDGSSRAVAEAADIVFTCLPGGSVRSAFDGPDGILAAAGELPLLVELSTTEIAEKARLREELAARGGDLLDAPISGTPEMAAAKKSVIYASGEQSEYERVAELLAEISPGATFVGELGSGTKTKYVANLLVLIHVAAASEAMAFATALGLDLDAVAELVARSPAASSGQFQVRAPLIAARRFEGRLATVGDARENLDQIAEAALEHGVSVPLATVAKDLFDEMGARGEDGSDPSKLAVMLGEEGLAAAGPRASRPL